MSSYNKYSGYIDACLRLKLAPSKFEFMKVNVFEPTKQDDMVMEAILDIDEVLCDLNLHKKWLDTSIKNPPFLTATPREYIAKNKRVGLFEARIYLTALRYYTLNWVLENDII